MYTHPLPWLSSAGSVVTVADYTTATASRPTALAAVVRPVDDHEVVVVIGASVNNRHDVVDSQVIDVLDTIAVVRVGTVTAHRAHCLVRS